MTKKFFKLLTLIIAPLMIAGCKGNTKGGGGSDTHTHLDANNDHYCDSCSQKISDCADNNRDHNCDTCAKKISDCADGDHNHSCDICETKLTDCVDNNKDHNCDICETKLTDCADNNKDHSCDLCGKKLTDCVDNNKDHNCDICGVKLSDCSDNNKDHNCDICETKLTDCIDNDKDHNCDICETKSTDCVDNNKDHNCDICETKLTDCVDANDDHYCDICETFIPLTAYVTYKSNSYTMSAANKLTVDVDDDPNIYFLEFSVVLGDEIQIKNSTKTFTNYATSDTAKKNAFKQSLITVKSNNHLVFNATGKFFIKIDISNSDSIVINYVSVTRYILREDKDSAGSNTELPFVPSETANPGVVCYQLSNYVFLKDQYIRVKTNDNVYQHFNKGANVSSTYFSFADKTNWTEMQYLKETEKYDFNVVLSYDVTECELTLDIKYVGYHSK